MNLLISVGRFLVALAAAIVVLGGIMAGGAALSNSLGWLTGAALGGLVGLVIAASVFGAIAAVFQIARNTEQTVILLERAERARGG